MQRCRWTFAAKFPAPVHDVSEIRQTKQGIDGFINAMPHDRGGTPQAEACVDTGARVQPSAWGGFGLSAKAQPVESLKRQKGARRRRKNEGLRNKKGVAKTVQTGGGAKMRGGAKKHDNTITYINS